MKNFYHHIVLFLVFGICYIQNMNAQVIKVELKQYGDKSWELLRNGEAYYVKGVGGHEYLDKVVEIGGNSIRTWGIENAQEILDDAHKRGLTVMLGFWVQHERHGFDYDDPAAVKKQLEAFTEAVKKFKDHPALLTWGIGNEVDLNYKNINVWDAIQDMAKVAHELDPNHPTTTVTAGLDKEEVRLINERCPDIDIYSINTYGDIVGVNKGIRDFGWDGPYMITEWGPNGHWETRTSSWNAPIEQTSTEKETTYRERYEKFISSDEEKCLGSYVFLWGQKQEKTATWYGMFSPDGKSSAGVDALHKLWKGDLPDNSAPAISRININEFGTEDDIYLFADSKNQAIVTASDVDNDKLKFKWEITSESLRASVGGDVEGNINSIAGLIKKRKGGSLSFRAPKEEGAYRLFVYCYDGKNHFATANYPFFVKPAESNSQTRFVELKKRTLDLPINN